MITMRSLAKHHHQTGKMRILLFSIIAFSMRGLIFPSGFSEIYVHESAYPFSIQYPDRWEPLDEDEWGGVATVSYTHLTLPTKA